MAKKPRKRFDPLAPSFKYQSGFKKAVRKRAKSQVQPLLQDVGQRRTEAQSAHGAREADLGRWYGNEENTRRIAQNQLGESLKGIMGAMTGYQGDAQAGLGAALRQQADLQGAEATRIGGVAPGINPEIANTLAAYGTAGQMGLGGDMAGILARGAAETGISGIAGRQAGVDEDARFKSVMDALTKERTDIRKTIPGLREAARGAILAEEQGKAGQAFQQNLAGEQFGETKRTNRFNERMTRKQNKLAREQFGEQKKENKFSRGERTARLGLDQQTLQLHRDELDAQIDAAADDGTKEALKEKGARFDKAAQWLEGYLQPTDRDSAGDPKDDTVKPTFNQRLYDSNHTFDEAYHAIQRKFGLGPLTALSVLGSVPNPRWRQRADQIKKIVKLKRRRDATGVKGPPTPTGIQP